jgi:alkylhydroperoxidase family enzyme
MSWIREDESVKLSDVIKVRSINPGAMEAVQNLTQATTFGASALTRVQEEALSTVVSAANKCRF